MLREFSKLRQDRTGFRRLFTDDSFDLYIWYDREGGAPRGFQLVYMKGAEQKALTWTEGAGFSHTTVEGWDSSRFNKTPFLVQDGFFDAATVLTRLEPELGELDSATRDYVLSRLSEWPAGLARRPDRDGA